MRRTPPSGIMDVADLLEKRELARRRRTSVSVEENMALVRRFLEARVKGDLDAMDEMMALNYAATPRSFPSKQPTAKA